MKSGPIPISFANIHHKSELKKLCINTLQSITKIPIRNPNNLLYLQNKTAIMEYSFYQIGDLIKQLSNNSTDIIPFDEFNNDDTFLLKSIIALIGDTKQEKKYLIQVLQELYSYTKKHLHRIDVWDIPKILKHTKLNAELNLNSRRFDGEVSIITDSDFIDVKSLDTEECNLIYTILKDGNGVIATYNIIASYIKRYNIAHLRKLTLNHWKRLFESIIYNIEEQHEQKQKKELEVYIPFLDEYRKPTSHVIRLFKLSIDVVEQLAINSPEYDGMATSSTLPSVNVMHEAMQKYVARQKDETLKNAMIYEMMRRGILAPIKEYVEHQDAYRLLFLSSPTPLSSEEADEYIHGKPNLRDRIAVLHCMLHEYDIPRGVISKIFNYLTFLDKAKFTRVDSDDTAYTYLKQVDKFMQDPIRKEYVIKTLKKFNYSDRIIKQLFPKQKK